MPASGSSQARSKWTPSSASMARSAQWAPFIAPKTVAAHVEHILTKLGVSRRSQVAAWITGQD